MPHHVTLDVADPDEVIRGALTRGHTRAQLFRRGAGAVVAGGLVIGGLPPVALGKPSAAQDVDILNFALLLEYLESTFYVQAVESGALTGELLDFARTVRDHELAHVEFLAKALGKKRIDKPNFDFKGIPADPAKFVATAITLEDLGVSAYDGQGTKLTKKTLAAAATIVSVEARHAAWIRRIAGAPPAPTDLNAQLSKKQVTAAVGQTGFIKA